MGCVASEKKHGKNLKRQTFLEISAFFFVGCFFFVVTILCIFWGRPPATSTSPRRKDDASLA